MTFSEVASLEHANRNSTLPVPNGLQTQLCNVAVTRDVGESAFLCIVLDDWDWLRTTEGMEVPLVTNEKDGTYLMMQAISCPGSKPEGWVWLRRIGPLPKVRPPTTYVRTQFPMPHTEDLHG